MLIPSDIARCPKPGIWRVLVGALASYALVALPAACTTVPDLPARDAVAMALASQAGLDTRVLDAGTAMPLMAHARIQVSGAPLSIYIEGDGYAWQTRWQPSDDPTPVNPVALRLAVIDTSPNVVYFARPGQYLHGTCSPRFWLSARFAPEVIDTFAKDVEDLAASTRSSTLRLIGYSGGGAIAALVAARLRRAHPEWHLSLYTVGGNVDIEAWVERRRITPLWDSLNPADLADVLRGVPQIHLTGLRDRQVPREVFESYAHRLEDIHCMREIQVDAAHAGPWEQAWRQVLAEPLPCGQAP